MGCHTLKRIGVDWWGTRYGVSMYGTLWLAIHEVQTRLNGSLRESMASLLRTLFTLEANPWCDLDIGHCVISRPTMLILVSDLRFVFLFFMHISIFVNWAMRGKVSPRQLVISFLAPFFDNNSIFHTRLNWFTSEADNDLGLIIMDAMILRGGSFVSFV